MTMIDLKENERIDDLQRCGLKIIQNKDMFCFGIDAVLLSSYATVNEGDKVLDLCSGNGIIPILLCGKTGASSITGLEIQKDCCELAERSIRMNGIEDKVNMICDDLKNIKECIKPSTFDVVTCNPPYMIDNHGIKNPDSYRAIARHEILCNFEDIVAAARYALKPGGRFVLIHRPFRLVELIDTMTRYNLEPKRMKMVHPYIDKEPNMVLIESTLGGKRRLTVDKPLVVYESESRYTQEIYDVYGY